MTTETKTLPNFCSHNFLPIRLNVENIKTFMLEFYRANEARVTSQTPPCRLEIGDDPIEKYDDCVVFTAKIALDIDDCVEYSLLRTRFYSLGFLEHVLEDYLTDDDGKLDDEPAICYARKDSSLEELLAGSPDAWWPRNFDNP
jgi:hypothetical protein